MSVRYQIGRALSSSERWVLSRKWFPLFSRFLSGRNWIYDTCRFANTRDFRVALDVGASIGNVARDLSRFFPAAEIHAFEPIAGTFEKLQSLSAHFPHIHTHRLALAEADGQARLALQGHSDLNSLHFRVAESSEVGTGELVEITTVDGFCTKNGVEFVDILKIDAQGCDLDVLRGAARMLRSHSVPFVLCEATFARNDPSNQEFGPLHDFLSEVGYQPCGIYDQLNHGPRQRYLACFNLLYGHPTAINRRFAT